MILLDFSLKIKQETKLTLTQEMKTSINILQMSSSNLREFLEKEAFINPAIEVNYSKNSTFKVSTEDEISPLDFVTKEETLIDYLEEQIGYLNISSKIKSICIFIINNLDNRGYLSISKSEIKKILGISSSALYEAFNIIHSLEPIGIGAENLKECLKIQLLEKKIEDRTCFELIDNYLESLAEKDFDTISASLNVSIKKIEECLNIIKTLSPIPARGYLIDTSSNYIVPEARITINNGKLNFELNDDVIPKININQNYLNSESPNKNFVYSAMNLIKCIEKRYQTLSRIINILIKTQKEFFFKGENYLTTLTFKDIAKELDLHESTISRAIKDKYVETPQGILSIKSLFILNSESIKIKNLIDTFITKENKKYPLSDEAISNLLKKHGFDVARRTVAKYREELGFPSTRERKRKF